MSKTTDLVKRPESQQFPVPVADANEWLWQMAGFSRQQRAELFKGVVNGLLQKCHAKRRPQAYDSKLQAFVEGLEEDDNQTQIRALEALPSILGLAKNPTISINVDLEGELPDYTQLPKDVTPPPLEAHAVVESTESVAPVPKPKRKRVGKPVKAGGRVVR